jgi:hypothetical protein
MRRDLRSVANTDSIVGLLTIQGILCDNKLGKWVISVRQ